MKLSVSLSIEDVSFLDEYARERKIASRSAVLQRAVDQLRASELGTAYAEAWEESHASGDTERWDSTAGDGLSH
jgi:Arc/MetJ-type ribon-helix-helix transcriptional regulator